MKQVPLAYTEGVQVAQKAIENGVPRWAVTTDLPFGQNIHPETGLPIMGLSGPTELQDYYAWLAKGNNDEVTAALNSGAIDVDFRPLLMGREECLAVLEKGALGILSPDFPELKSPDDVIVIGIRRGRQGRQTPNPTQWICYTHEVWGSWPKFAVYDEPTEFAISRSGTVLVEQTSAILLTRDVKTTQVLNSYLL